MTIPLLQVHELCVNFQTRQGRVCALENINFCIHKGETVAVVGESGSGKSVLSGLGMGICLSLWIKIMGEMNIWITTLGGVVVGVVLYTVFSWALKAPELKMLSISMSRRIKG